MHVYELHIVTGRPYPLRGSGERPPDGLPHGYEAASFIIHVRFIIQCLQYDSKFNSYFIYL